MAPEIYDTIVIGAGMSGLACASRLQQHISKSGFKRKVLVLEARNRIGGRIGTETVNGCRLDTGANWIHGVGTEERSNPLMDILPDKRIRTLTGTVAFKAPPPPKDCVEDDWHVVQTPSEAVTAEKDAASNENNDLIIPAETAGMLMGTTWQMFGDLHEVANSTPAKEAKTTTMLKAISRSVIFQEAFREVAPEYHGNLRALPQFVEGMEAAPLVAQSAEGPDDAPGMGLLEYAIEDFDGQQVFVQDGYTSVVEKVAEDLLRADAVQLGTEVDQIQWDSSPITVKSKDGKTYQAANVVCTLPLGVLKAKYEGLFSPALPKEKKDAISSLGFGTLDKIFMVYDHAWWADEPFFSILKKGLVQAPGEVSESEPPNQVPDTIMGFTWALPGVSVSPDGSCAPGPRSLFMANLDALTGYPVLSTFVSCANAHQLEALPDSHARELIHTSLTTWLGREPPKPTAVHVTRWAKDEYARGSYTHMITGVSETEHRTEFKECLDISGRGTLGFAGEHTSRSHFATVHGALISGWREADRILKVWQTKEE